MNLQTNIPLSKHSNNLIDYQSNILLLGSCFVENIGEKLGYFKFKNLVNPFGVLFHPKAIEKLIERSLNLEYYSEKEVFFHNEQWHCFDVHSKLSNPSKDNLLKDLNNHIDASYHQLKKATHIVITLGTAWVYHNLETQKSVANCHKVPQRQFSKKLLSVTDILESLQKIVALVKRVNADVQIIFTVSPIRHLKDGFIENMRSKAHLLAAMHQVVESYKSKEDTDLSYFPSYEIMMDELRDYRFYAEDMIHPSQTAVNYIWEKFKEVWVFKEAQKVMEEVDIIQKGLLHRPFNPNSEAHQKFVKNLYNRKKDLENRFPTIKF
ncbi:GSCFA domain-containing protein [Seonamhaeicola marinus]|uniref:GSCFA domain-containing protein n=1 Tax=Seonamhaeicola marinus TaxID=1912246 RepID=A0A5D0HVX2_9FLAO|nr:GSCFA domain-containing protein [Seonamhaeicola marinus]TYA74980.1 GSCFA domain-containing protein [Seonamhaeicola marinus]